MLPWQACAWSYYGSCRKGYKIYFYPSITWEKKEQKEADNSFNCPIVISYPEVIKNNDVLRKKGILYLHPFLPYDNPKEMVKVIRRA